ncbi:MAG TPA: FkbM family methyltransferase [Gaiellaceae bacterium]|nr:FkbM family methyltransferase [Gaiellaceae bacterium]
MSLAGRTLKVLLRPLGERVVTIRSGPLAGARMELDVANEKSFWSGSYEPEVRDVIEALDLDGKPAWDVGAHAGYFTLMLAWRGAHVVSLEPNADTAARLRRNVALNGATVDVVEAAATVEEGEVSFTVVEGQRRAESRISDTDGVRVQAVTLDGLLDRFGAPAFVKMDIEGAELPALRAAPRLLAAKPTVLVEVHRKRHRDELEALFASAAYDVRWIGPRLLATP